MSFIASTLVDLAICLSVGYMFKKAVAPTPTVLKTEPPIMDPPQEVMKPHSQTPPTPPVIAPFSTIKAPLAVTSRSRSYSPQRDWTPSPYVTERAWSPSERSTASADLRYPKPMLPPAVAVTVQRTEAVPKPAPVKEEEEEEPLVSPLVTQVVEEVPAPASSRRSVSPTKSRRSRKHVQRLDTPPPHSLRFKAIARQRRSSKHGRPRRGSNTSDPGQIFDPMWENHLYALHDSPYFSEPTGFAPRPFFVQEEPLLVDRYSQLIDVVMDDESWDTPDTDEDMSSETGSSTAHTDEEDRDVLMSDPEDSDDDSMECDVVVNTKAATKVEVAAEEVEEEKGQEEGGEEEPTTKAASPRHMTQDAAETASPVRKHIKGKLSSDSQTLASSLSSPRDINMAGPIDEDEEEEADAELEAPAKGKVEGQQPELKEPHQNQKTPSKNED